MAQSIDLPKEAPAYRWVVVGLLLTYREFAFVTMATLGLLLPAITSELRLSPSQQGLLASAAAWGVVALAIPVSLWVSRYRPKALTTVALLLGTLLLTVQGWAPVFALLLIGRLGFGIAMLVREPARAILVQQWIPRREIILVSSASNVLYGLLVGGGLLLTPYLLSTVGNDWRLVFYLFGGVSTAVTILWIALGREKASDHVSRQDPPWEGRLLVSALRYRDVWVTGFGFLGVHIAMSAFLNFFPTLMLDRYGVSLQWSGTFLALTTLAGGFAGLGVSYLAARFDKRKSILLILGILMSGSYLGMAFNGSIPLLVALSLLNGIAWGFWPILHTVPFQIPNIRPREVAIALAFVMTMTGLGGFLGPLISGLLQGVWGSLRPTLVVVSFTPLSLSVAGMLLKPARGDR